MNLKTLRQDILAGLVTIVTGAIETLGSLSALLLALIIAGRLQFIDTPCGPRHAASLPRDVRLSSGQSSPRRSSC